jgi:hypothetical protein
MGYVLVLIPIIFWLGFELGRWYGKRKAMYRCGVALGREGIYELPMIQWGEGFQPEKRQN